MLMHSQHGKRNARPGCGKGSSFPEAAAPQGEAALHSQGEQVTTMPVAHLARKGPGLPNF